MLAGESPKAHSSDGERRLDLCQQGREVCVALTYSLLPTGRNWRGFNLVERFVDVGPMGLVW